MLTETPQKLLVIITSNADGDTLIDTLVGRGYPATKVGSTGGFLQKGNATIFSGIDADDVDSVLAIIRQTCEVRIETIPSNTLPFPGTGNLPSEPLQVRSGGAIVFVIPVDQFEKT